MLPHYTCTHKKQLNLEHNDQTREIEISVRNKTKSAFAYREINAVSGWDAPRKTRTCQYVEVGQFENTLLISLTLFMT